MTTSVFFRISFIAVLFTVLTSNASFATNGCIAPMGAPEHISIAAFFAPTRTITLQEGEPIYLEVMNDGDIDKLEIGNTIQFRVTSNVIVDGKEVIRAFAPAFGTVTRKANSTYNTAGNIQINVRHVRAVDGKQVLVDGPINLNSLTIGTQTTVYVKNAVDIEVR